MKMCDKNGDNFSYSQYIRWAFQDRKTETVD